MIYTVLNTVIPVESRLTYSSTITGIRIYNITINGGTRCDVVADSWEEAERKALLGWLESQIKGGDK